MPSLSAAHKRILPVCHAEEMVTPSLSIKWRPASRPLMGTLGVQRAPASRPGTDQAVEPFSPARSE